MQSVDDERLSHTALANVQPGQGVLSPSAGGVSIGPLHPGCDQNLQSAMEQVGGQLRQLLLQRQTIDRRIAILKHTIKGLTLFYGEALLGSPTDVAAGERRSGITHACRLVLDQADAALTARELYAALQKDFPDLFRTLGNHRASLFTILNGLTKYGEIHTFLWTGSRLWQKREKPDN